MTPSLPTGTVTFLFTDIEGSTRLLHELGRERYRIVEEEHGVLLRRAIEEADGRVVRTEGDSFFAVFATPTGAVCAAVVAQRAVADHSFSHGGPLRIRMGMHTGEGHVGSGDYVGLDVNRAARIAAAGHGGQVVLSEATKALVEHGLPPGVSLRDLGSHRLKDISHAERVYDLVIDGLPSQFPPLATLDVPTNLPTQLTSFIGRDQELARLEDLLGEIRLLTLVGPGGSGKTRLAVALASRVGHRFPQGVFFVDLASITDPGLVLTQIALTLSLREQSGRPLIEVVGEHLMGRRALLILDNFEQVLEAASDLHRLLEAAPRLTAVVTTRARLNILGEHEFPVPPLGIPDRGSDPGVVAKNEAARLFRERARAVRPSFEITEENAPTVAEICARLDGLPLALELAAAQVRLLSLPELLARLSGRLEALVSAARNLPERQRTLRETITWSYDLLGTEQRALFDRLSVFVGGATLEAVEAVCNPGGDLGTNTLEPLASLVDHSLVRSAEVSGGSRFTMLETIRDFGLERLVEERRLEDARERHAGFFVAMAEAAEQHLTGRDRDTWADRLERDHGNLWAALRWSIERDRADVGLRLVPALWRFWQMRGHLREGRQMADAVLALPSAVDPSRDRARTLLARGSIAYWRDDMAAARAAYQDGLGLARRVDAPELVAEALFDLGYVEMAEQNFDVADELFRQAAERREALGDRPGRAWVDVGRAWVLLRQERLDEAVALLEGALPTFREVGDVFAAENVVGSIGAVELRRGNVNRAEEMFRQNLTAGGETNLYVGIAAMASVAIARGDPVRALRLWGAFEAMTKDTGGLLPMALWPLGDTRAEASGRLDEETAAAAREQGRRMSPADALRYALAEDREP